MFKIIYNDELVRNEKIAEEISVLLDVLIKSDVLEGDVVAFKSNTYYGTIIQWMVCCRAKFIPLWVPYEYKDDYIYEIIGEIHVKGILNTKSNKEHVFTKVKIQDNNSHRDSINQENLEIGSILHITSATTGIPKIIKRTQNQLNAEIDRYISLMNFTDKDVFLPIVPLHHSFGFVCSFLTALKCNSTIVLLDLILPRNVIQACNRHKVTTLLGVPRFYKKMLPLAQSFQFEKSMKYIISSSESLDDEFKGNFEKKFGITLIQMYGSTETGCLAVSSKTDKANCFSRPFNGVEIKTKTDNEGMSWMYVKSVDTVGTYLRSNQELIKSGDYIKMGDLGRILDNNTFQILGRGDDVIIVSGKKFSLDIVRKTLERNLDIVQFNLYIDSNNGDLTCDYVSLLEPFEIRRYCRKYLLEYQMPKCFFKVDLIQKSYKWKENI